MKNIRVILLDSKEKNSSRFEKFIWTTLHNSTCRRGQQGGWGHHSLDGGLPSGSQIIIKKRTKKRFSSWVSYFFLPTRPQLMQCLYETRVSNTEWRKSLVRGLSFFLSEIGQVTLKVEPWVCARSFYLFVKFDNCDDCQARPLSTIVPTTWLPSVQVFSWPPRCCQIQRQRDIYAN